MHAVPNHGPRIHAHALQTILPPVTDGDRPAPTMPRLRDLHVQGPTPVPHDSLTNDTYFDR